MKNHQHIFKRRSGGCLTKVGLEDWPEREKNPCDDHYRCDCGLELRIYSSPKVHFALPSEIVGRVEKR